jgi:outer membrane protein
MLTNFIRKTILMACIFLGTVSISGAQTVMQLSLDSARHYALEHNKTLLNAGLAVDEAQARLRETISNGLPQVNATVDYNNFFGSTVSIGAFPFPIEFNPTSNLSVSVGQLIFSGSYWVGLQTVKLYKEVTETTREKTELEIKAMVTQAYYLALVSQRSMEIVEANLTNMRDLLGKTRALVYAGVAEELDYDQLAQQATMIGNGLKASERQVELALNMLRLQMGLGADVDISLTDKLEDVINNSDAGASLFKPFTLKNNQDYQLLDLQTSLAQKQVNMEKAAYLPTVTGFYNYTEKILKPEFDLTPKHVIGLNVSIPIFSSGARYARVSQARINLEIAENQKELVSDQLLIQEKQLRFNLNNALEQFQSQQANLDISRRVIKNINNKFQQGMVSSLDLTTANSNYLQAENSYIAALMQLLDAKLALDKLLNQL